MPQPHPGQAHAWAAATRPASLPIAVGPVLVGAALAHLHTSQVPWLLAALALLAALLMQLATNLQNDVGYTQRGGEARGTRQGLPRATAEGWLGVGTVQSAVVGVSLVALLLGLVLVVLRGWPVLAIGAVSLVAALAYMGGPKPIAYTPWGEVTVLVFFGWVAVLGTEWLLSDQVTLLGAIAATGVGCTPAAALAINNHRDAEHDRSVGRRTFAVTWGHRASQGLVAVLLVMPHLAALWLVALTGRVWWALPLALLPHTWGVWQRFRRCAPGVAYNAVLFQVFRLSLWYAVWLAVAAVWGR
jgi:1,4-dihydroxy-2-naphthoate octaprenyltransferase